MTRFLCVGDLHAGAGPDLGVEPGERLAEQEAVLDWIVARANELAVPLLFAGDAWERRRPTPAEILAFRRPLENLVEGCVAIAGNHDVEAFGRPTGYDVFAGLTNVQAYSAPRVIQFQSSGGGVLIACLPWAPPSRLVALEGGGDRDALNVRLAGGLVDIARGLFAEIEQERERRFANGATLATPAILLTHWSVSGATASSGIPTELFREPVLSAEALEAIGFDAIVAGHIHRPQMIGERSFYVGSPMPLNFGEAGHDHAVWLLDVEPGAFQAFQIPVPSRPLVTVDLTGEEALETVDAEWSPTLDVRDAVVKIRLKASEEQARRIDVGVLKREALAAGARKVWTIQVEVERQETARLAAVDETLGDVEAMELWLEAQGLGEDRLEALLERHVTYVDGGKP